MRGLRVLVVDDEKLARDDLAWLLGQVDGVCEVLTACGGADALRTVTERDDIDALFLDIQMPGLSGVELVRVLRNFKNAPAVAFVTAYDDYAVDAFDLDVCDYLKKPVDQDRLEDTIRRMRLRSGVAAPEPPASTAALRRLSGRTGNSSFSVDRDDVDVVEAAGDYVRLHLSPESAGAGDSDTGDSYLVRESISSLTSAWSSSGFVRIHRSYLVRGSAIREFRTVDGRRAVDIGGHEYPVSRRYTRLLQDHFGDR
ncbi:MAG: LytR/AlgR family response regulator transcription factor [Ilumatobacter sp.]